MKQPLTAHWCNVLEYVEILWALSDPSPVTGIYFETHSHSHPHPPLSWPTPRLPMPPSPTKTHSGLLCSPTEMKNICPPLPLTSLYCATELRPWAQNGLGALGLVSAGCHGLLKAGWRHHHAAAISAYLCIRRASSLCAWLHGCGYSSL